MAPLGSGAAFNQKISVGSTAPNFLAATVYIFEGVSQSNPVDESISRTRRHGSTAPALSIDINSEVGDIVLDGITSNTLFMAFFLAASKVFGSGEDDIEAGYQAMRDEPERVIEVLSGLAAAHGDEKQT